MLLKCPLLSAVVSTALYSNVFFDQPSPYSLSAVHRQRWPQIGKTNTPFETINAILICLRLRHAPMLFPPIIIAPMILPSLALPSTFPSPAPPTPFRPRHLDLIRILIRPRPRVDEDLVNELAYPVRSDVYSPTFHRNGIIEDGLAGMTFRLQRLQAVSSCS